MGWARTHERPLPWRGERDPYRVLVSEVMLQQTQAGRVKGRYEAFVERFPTAATLADADPDEVLRAWGDLGYPRRALYLWRAAAIVRDGFPSTPEALEALPGVGPYTARAVASFAFGADVGVVEANVRRILERLCGRYRPPDVQDVADRLTPPGASARWNQALMDLGADVCRPRNPRCDVCPIRRWCAWAAGERRDVRPRRRPPPFGGTMRYARGRVLRALREATPLTVGQLAHRTGLGKDRAEAAVQALVRDGLVSRSGGRVALGPVYRARERRSAASRTR